MDASHESTKADDQNTNQNEANVSCTSILNSDGPLEGRIVIEKLETNDNVLENWENNSQNTGTCNTLNLATGVINEVDTEGNTSADHNFPIVETSSCDREKPADNCNDSVLIGTPDESINLELCDSSCPRTPSEQQQKNDRSVGDSSAVNLSMTSDDDIKVTCPCSSTPVNYSMHKTLNDTDCSMPSVGDTSPISSVDADTKVRANQKYFPQENDNPNVKSSQNDQMDNKGSLIYAQPESYNKKPQETQGPVSGEDHSRGTSYYSMDRSQPSNFHQNYQTHLARPYDYPSYHESINCGYNDFNFCDQRSLTDVKNRPDLQSNIGTPQSDLCYYPTPTNSVSEREYFVYPSIYVSHAGLISVLLRNDMTVEMTVDRTIRVVSHNNMMAVATDSKGTAASLYHPAVKIFQMGYNTDIATDMFRAKMSQGEAIFFSNGANCFKLQEFELQPLAPITFSDIHRDQSVNFIFSSEGYGESLVATCMQVAAQAEYANLPKGGVIVRINGVKVTQSGCGDVTVVTGAKFIRLSPHNGTTRLGNRFVDIEVERDWSVKLTRGTHSFINTKKRTMVSNGKMEAGFDENNGLKVVNLQSRHPLLVEPSSLNRRPGKRMVRTPPASSSVCFTPRRRFTSNQNSGRGGMNTC